MLLEKEISLQRVDLAAISIVENSPLSFTSKFIFKKLFIASFLVWDMTTREQRKRIIWRAYNHIVNQVHIERKRDSPFWRCVKFILSTSTITKSVIRLHVGECIVKQTRFTVEVDKIYFMQLLNILSHIFQNELGLLFVNPSFTI